MQLLSLQFALCFAALLALYWIAPKKAWQNALLLVGSIGFIGTHSLSAAVCVIVSTFIEWRLALAMGAVTERRPRLMVLWGSILLNVGQLAFFKYSQFFLPELATVLKPAGISLHVMSVLMPVGLSFWTLQKMTLTLDVFYRRKPATQSYWECLLFTAFFPTLLSGPIEFSRKLLPQFQTARTISTGQVAEAVWLLAMGAFHKAVIADNIGASVEVLMAPGHSGFSLLIGIWAYAVQIYADFAGYSYLARGCARLLGLDITQNFLAPYLAPNLSDFWKRWHVSLSGWLNEFIFVPTSLALRNWGTMSIIAAVWVTFLASGLWHGTGMAYVVWGSVHAVGLTIFNLTHGWRKRVKKKYGSAGWLKWSAVAVNFNWVCLGYFFFRAGHVGVAVDQLRSLFGHLDWDPVVENWNVIVPCTAVIFWLQSALAATKNEFWIFQKPIWFRAMAYLVLAFLLMRFYAPADRFIYFQF